MARWQSRLARIPRWAWIAFFIGAVIPLVVTLLLLVVTAVVTGVLVMAAVIIVGAVLGFVWRVFHRRRLPDSDPHGEIIVRNVRVIDP